jgi:hypothetical protein
MRRCALVAVALAACAGTAHGQACSIQSVFVRRLRPSYRSRAAAPTARPADALGCVCVCVCVHPRLTTSNGVRVVPAAQSRLTEITDSSAAGHCCTTPGSCSDGFPGERDACPVDCGVVFEPFWDECGTCRYMYRLAF